MNISSSVVLGRLFISHTPSLMSGLELSCLISGKRIGLGFGGGASNCAASEYALLDPVIVEGVGSGSGVGRLLTIIRPSSSNGLLSTLPCLSFHWL